MTNLVQNLESFILARLLLKTRFFVMIPITESLL